MRHHQRRCQRSSLTLKTFVIAAQQPFDIPDVPETSIPPPPPYVPPPPSSTVRIP